jgi:hypothetical protein
MTATPNVSPVEAGERRISRRVVVPATAGQLFDLVADPYRHAELDGSGTVHAGVRGPHRLGLGDRFSMAMTFHRIPYRITSTVTGFEENRLLEWQHPFGHRWRWEFTELQPGRTQVTETWDYREARWRRFFSLVNYDDINSEGISRTLEGLRARFATAAGPADAG